MYCLKISAAIALLSSCCHGFNGLTNPSRLSDASSKLHMATWSNGQAIREYQDFLASGKQEIELKNDGPSVIVTDGSPVKSPLVKAMITMGMEEDTVVPMGTPTLPEFVGGKTEYPIYVAVPPNKLEDFLKDLPDGWSSRRDDLVFFSGTLEAGCIEPVLKKFGYARDSMTQVLIGGFTMPDNDFGKPRDISCKIGLDSQGADKWAGECGACGKWAGAFANRLDNFGIRCRTGFYREWRRWMWERAVFDGVFNLVGGVRKEPTSIADVANYYDSEVSDMSWQLSQNLRGYLAVTLTYGFEERMFGFAEREGLGTAAKLCSPEMYPFVYGNAPFENSKMIVEYLNYAKEDFKAFEGAKVPTSSSFDGRPPSAMRQGNLRSDGKI